MVTNFRELQPARAGAPSRGNLIPRFLADRHDAGEFFGALASSAPGYSGFNLLLADDDSLWYGSNRAAPFARALNAGVYGLSNELLDTPWPKLLRVRRGFEAWLAQLANYAFITILTVLIAALMLRVVTVSAQQAVSTGGGIQIANAVRVCMAAGLTFLVMRQVMPMAAGLASGLALSSFGVVSAAVAWGFGGALRGTGQFARGLVDAETNRWDPLSRQAGYRVRRAVLRAAALGFKRDNQIRRSA